MDNTHIVENEGRRSLIRYALMRMKNQGKDFLQEYTGTKEWAKIHHGLVSHRYQVPLNTLVQLQLCQTTSQQESFFNPFQKHPITLCYNKINDVKKFNKLLTYNLILYYDTKVKKKMNWNNLQQAVVAHTRALSLSQTCEKWNTSCFQKQLQRRVLSKQRFKSMQKVDISEFIKSGIQDSSPMSQVIFYD